MSAILDFPIRPEARPYLDAFAAARIDEPDWLAGQRERGIARFAELGFPSRKSEAWRYVDLRVLERAPMLPIALSQAATHDAAAIERFHARLGDIALHVPSYRVILVDGRFCPGLSRLEHLPSGVWLGATSEALGAKPDLLRESVAASARDLQPFGALNTAFFRDGFVLDIPSGVALDRPVEIIHLASGAAGGSLHTRNLVVLGEGSSATLLESFVGDGAYWRNDVSELRLGAGADLHRTVVIEEAAEATHFSDFAAALGPGSRFAGFVLVLGGRTVRHEAAVTAEERVRCNFDGAFLLSGREEANIVTTIDHAGAHCETREIMKGVAAGRAHGAFQGRFIVREDAQKVDAHQLSRNLLLGRRASIDTKPELEIYADDVKCSHGATVGDLDETALFYLRSRGIPAGEARRILIDAFVREAVDLVESIPVRGHLLSRLVGRLEHLQEAE